MPEASARDANGAWAAATALNAATALVPAACAGSSLGPSRTKSLCITAARLSPCPWAMYVSSAAGECTNSTSASPLAPMASASPEPTATVLTRQRLPDSYDGTSMSSRPESWVLVVVPRMSVPLGALDDVPPPCALLASPLSLGLPALRLLVLGPPQPATSTTAAAAAQTPPARAEPPTPSPWCGSTVGATPT